jgi:hypothetical protein
LTLASFDGLSFGRVICGDGGIVSGRDGDIEDDGGGSWLDEGGTGDANTRVIIWMGGVELSCTIDVAFVLPAPSFDWWQDS